MVQATCTDGPSFPTESPEAITRGFFCSHFRNQVHLPERHEKKFNYQRQTLDEERPKAEESLDDKTRYDALDLRNPRAGSVLRQ